MRWGWMDRSSRIGISARAALGLALGLCVPSLCLAALERAVSWESMQPISQDRVAQSQFRARMNLLEPRISEEAISGLVEDPHVKIRPEFRAPRELRGPVEFWLRVFAVYSTRHVVIFDERHPEIVYDVLDLRSERGGEERLVKKAVATVKRTLESLARNPHPRHPTPEQTRVLAAIAKAPHRHPFRDLIRNIRTQRGQRDNVARGLLASSPYFPRMEQIFDAMGIPKELTRLSLIESSFNVEAVSYVGATGVWQFMPDSASEFLRVDAKKGIDERRSPLKSTVAAGLLLKRNMRLLRNWPLAVTSYNHGLKDLLRLPRRQRDQWKAVQLLKACGSSSEMGWAGRNYYAEFLAILIADAYKDQLYGEVPGAPAEGARFVEVDRTQPAFEVGLRTGVSWQAFSRLNPDVKAMNTVIPRGFWVLLPNERDSFDGFVRSLDHMNQRVRAHRNVVPS